ncbi:MAG: phage major capsid protein [Christensenellales bacterium]|jgi:HK97 family phage prohead protease|nr:phage major capsid protein [Christensenellales bacterium]
MDTSNYDFAGWATRNNVKCSDGRVIMQNAFQGNNGAIVPLVWNHQHDNPDCVLGQALLENRPEGVYAYCRFNGTESGNTAKELVEHGDVSSLSIFANQLKEQGSNVLHGNIREVSLVLAGANPKAYIEDVFAHSDDEEEDGIRIYMGEPLTSLSHSDTQTESAEKQPDDTKDDDETVGDVFNSLTEKQKKVFYFMLAKAMNEGKADGEDDENKDANNKEEKTVMKHNVFDQTTDETNGGTLSHDAMNAIIKDTKRFGTMKESYLQHADEYGIENIEYLFPEAHNLNETPEFIKRDTGWVSNVMSGVHHSPFSRIKSMFANITEDQARAKGYIKGNLKKDEVFSLLKRTTTPTTVYKKQKIDKDDWDDITDFNVVSWLKTEMRMMLDEELARAYLLGDGRSTSDDDKINEQNIRPVAKDEALFTIQKAVNITSNATDDDKAKAFIKAVIRSRKEYKGSGNPTLYTTEDMLTTCLLLTDTTGRDIYEDVNQLCKKLRVKEIVTVPVMEGVKAKDGNDMLAILVNMNDYNVGADKGGSVNMFDDFDIDYNQQKFLMETRCSGALTKPYSAIVYSLVVA